MSDEINTKNLNIKINDLNNNEHFGGTAINVGNPHVIFFVDELKILILKKLVHKLKIIRCFQKNVMLHC